MVQTIIAQIFDFDGNLSPYNMQKYIFEDPRFNKITENEFFKRSNENVKMHKKRGIDVVEDTAYLHQMCQMVKPGCELEGLTRDIFIELGKNIKYYPGVKTFLKDSKQLIESNPIYQKNDIKLEQYIVSSGQADMLRGTDIAQYMDHIFACEFFYDENNVPIGPARAVNHMMKVEALFCINKGVHLRDDISVKTYMPEEERRVPFSNMIYYDDGLTGVDAMSIIKARGGYTFAPFNPKSEKAAQQAIELQQTGRADFAVKADYRKNSTNYILSMKVLKQVADRIVFNKEK